MRMGFGLVSGKKLGRSQVPTDTVLGGWRAEDREPNSQQVAHPVAWKDLSRKEETNGWTMGLCQAPCPSQEHSRARPQLKGTARSHPTAVDPS